MATFIVGYSTTSYDLRVKRLSAGSPQAAVDKLLAARTPDYTSLTAVLWVANEYAYQLDGSGGVAKAVERRVPVPAPASEWVTTRADWKG